MYYCVFYIYGENALSNSVITLHYSYVKTKALVQSKILMIDVHCVRQKILFWAARILWASFLEMHWKANKLTQLTTVINWCVVCATGVRIPSPIQVQRLDLEQSISANDGCLEQSVVIMLRSYEIPSFVRTLYKHWRLVVVLCCRRDVGVIWVATLVLFMRFWLDVWSIRVTGRGKMGIRSFAFAQT